MISIILVLVFRKIYLFAFEKRLFLVYNDVEDAFYIHHDIILPSFPLALEWINYDPGEKLRGRHLTFLMSWKPSYNDLAFHYLIINLI